MYILGRLIINAVIIGMIYEKKDALREESKKKRNKLYKISGVGVLSFVIYVSSYIFSYIVYFLRADKRRRDNDRRSVATTPSFYKYALAKSK